MDEICGVPVEIIEGWIQIMKNVYPDAKKGIIHLEVHEGTHFIEHITEVRDALDHSYRAITSDSLEGARMNLTEVSHHLRRAAVEPYELSIENRLYEIEKRLELSIFSRILFISLPNRDYIQKKLEIVKANLTSGRLDKNRRNWKEALEKFLKAYEIVKQLDGEIPGINEYLGRTFTLGVAVVILILTLILS